MISAKLLRFSDKVFRLPDPFRTAYNLPDRLFYAIYYQYIRKIWVVMIWGKDTLFLTCLRLSSGAMHRLYSASLGLLLFFTSKQSNNKRIFVMKLAKIVCRGLSDNKISYNIFTQKAKTHERPSNKPVSVAVNWRCYRYVMASAVAKFFVICCFTCSL